MVRSAVAILALLVFPGIAQAQQRHEVVQGETLWSLAQRYYGDPWRWPRIYEANRAPSGEVEEAHWIYPGEVLVIPDVEVTAAVSEVTVEPASGPSPEPARPAPLVEPERTVFYQPEGLAAVGFAGPVLSTPAVPREISVAAPWLEPFGAEPPNLGRIVEFSGAEDELVPRQTAFVYDRVRIRLPDIAPARGTELLAFRVIGEVDGVGRVMVPTGVLAVSDPTPDGAVALVVTVFDKIEMGDYLQLLPAFPLRPGVRPEPTRDGPEATILGFARDHALLSIHDVAFLDRGSDAGVSVGDEYVVRWIEESGGPAEIEGRLQVISVRPDHSSARIISLRNPVFQTGARVGLDRKMP